VNYCTRCGANISGANFCPQCGHSVNPSASPTATSSSPAPAPKRSGGNTWKYFVALVFVLLLWLSVQSTRDHGSTSSSSGRSSGCRIIYSVIGSASRASLTYQNESGGTEQMLVSLPWNTEFNARRGAFLYLSAQSRERNSAIEVEIRSNSIEVQKAQSCGDFVIATAHGRAQ